MLADRSWALAFAGGASTTFLSIGATAYIARHAIASGKNDQRARYGAFCAAIGFGMGILSKGAIIGADAAPAAADIGAFLGFGAILLLLYNRWSGPRRTT